MTKPYSNAPMLIFGRQIIDRNFDNYFHDASAILIESISAAFIIGWLYVDRTPPKLMSSKPAAFIGEISYSLYLIHLPILGLIAGIGGEKLKLSFFNGNPLADTLFFTEFTLLISVPTASIIYRFIEPRHCAWKFPRQKSFWKMCKVKRKDCVLSRTFKSIHHKSNILRHLKLMWLLVARP